MKSRLGILALLHAALWVMVNVAWLTVGAEQVTGSQLSSALNLAPAIALIMLLISAYKKLQRTLWLSSGLSSGMVALVILTSDFAKSPAVVSILESMTGIQNASPADAGIVLTPGLAVWISALLSVLVLAASIYFALAKPLASKQAKIEEISDNRSLWDEQQ